MIFNAVTNSETSVFQFLLPFFQFFFHPLVRIGGLTLISCWKEVEISRKSKEFSETKCGGWRLDFLVSATMGKIKKSLPPKNSLEISRLL